MSRRRPLPGSRTERSLTPTVTSVHTVRKTGFFDQAEVLDAAQRLRVSCRGRDDMRRGVTGRNERVLSGDWRVACTTGSLDNQSRWEESASTRTSIL